MLSARLIYSVADELLFSRGEFDPLQFLVSAGLLDEDDHRDWLTGRRSELRSRLHCTLDEAVAVLERARAYLCRQGLTAQPRAAHVFDARADRRLDESSRFVELCSTCLVASGAQRDLFQDSAPAVAESELKSALAAHRLGAARGALVLLHSLGGPPEMVDGYRRLIGAAERNAGDAAAQLRHLEDVVAPLAAKYLGHHAFTYMAALWRALADRLRNAPFSAASPELHSSYAHLRAAQWRSVIDDIERETDWQRHPVLVARLAEAHVRCSDRPAARRLCALLCWSHPDAAPESLGSDCADPLLANRWREFCDGEPYLPAQDFPAWLLIVDPSQRGFVPASVAPKSPAGVAYSVMYRLTAGHDDIDARRELKAYNAALLEHYLAALEGARR